MKKKKIEQALTPTKPQTTEKKGMGETQLWGSRMQVGERIDGGRIGRRERRVGIGVVVEDVVVVGVVVVVGEGEEVMVGKASREGANSGGGRNEGGLLVFIDDGGLVPVEEPRHGEELVEAGDPLPRLLRQQPLQNRPTAPRQLLRQPRHPVQHRMQQPRYVPRLPPKRRFPLETLE